MDRALYRFVSGRLPCMETRFSTSRNISWGCILRSFGIENAVLFGTNWVCVFGKPNRKVEQLARAGDCTFRLDPAWSSKNG